MLIQRRAWVTVVFVIFNFYMRCYLVVFSIYLSRGYESAAYAVIFLGLECYAADFPILNTNFLSSIYRKECQ